MGDTVLMSGPHHGGHWVDGMAKKVGFVAGGTGITPMISIIRWILTERLDAELFLVFANKTEADIIFRDEWEREVRAHPNFHCCHVLEQPPAGWLEETGRVTADILRLHLPLRATTDDERPGRDTPRARLSRRVCHPPVNRPPGITSERFSTTSSH